MLHQKRSFFIVGSKERTKRATTFVSRYLSTNNSSDDYLRNKGIVEGVWIFCRHGDRAPSRPLSPPHKLEEEAEFWASRLPRPGSFLTFQEFSRYFTPDIHDDSNDEKFLDTRRYPFGFLTHKGMEQTREIGKRLFRRYNRHGHHLPDKENYFDAKGFLECWDVNVFSTNYLRTIMSIQSFLDGLLGTDCYKSLQHDSIAGTSDARIPDHNDFVPFDDTIVRVQVRGRSDDTLNAFDRNPELMSELVSEVISSAEFQDIDGKAAPMAARLANLLPGLARKKKNINGFNAAPSGINWIEATDHFVCRSSHNVELSRFSDFEHDDAVEQTLSAMSYQTKAHLAWRFRQWYKSPRLLATIAAPPLREIAHQLLHAKSMGPVDRHPFTIYSCHDVTILAILYGIGAEFLAGDDAAGYRRFWPEYSSTLVLELVRISDEDSDHSHVVRVLLNGQPVTTVDTNKMFWEGAPGACQPAGRGPRNMLLTEDFVNIVSKLEESGGYSRDALKVDDSKAERDISNWTG